MGEIGIGRSDQTLRTLLGSCVAVVIYDGRKRTAGMAHIQLPDSGGRRGLPLGKYADTAIPELVRLVEGLSGGTFEPVAYVAGGADMFRAIRRPTVGQLNVLAVESILKTMQISVLSRHCGGNQARRMWFEIETGSAIVETLRLRPADPGETPMDSFMPRTQM